MPDQQTVVVAGPTTAIVQTALECCRLALEAHLVRIQSLTVEQIQRREDRLQARLDRYEAILDNFREPLAVSRSFTTVDHGLERITDPDPTMVVEAPRQED